MHKKLIIMKFKSTLEIIDMKYIVWKFNGITVEIIGWRGVLDTTLCDKVCRWLATDLLFFPGTPFSSTNKTNRHDVTEILLNVALNTIYQPKPNQT